MNGSYLVCRSYPSSHPPATPRGGACGRARQMDTLLLSPYMPLCRLFLSVCRIHLATLPQVREADIAAGPGRWIRYSLLLPTAITGTPSSHPPASPRGGHCGRARQMDSLIHFLLHNCPPSHAGVPPGATSGNGRKRPLAPVAF